MRQLRQQMRERRRAFSQQERLKKADQLLAQFQLLPWLDACQHIAAYFAFDGEIDPQPIVEYLWQLQKSVYMPVLKPQTKIMHFSRYEKKTVLKNNRFQIPEPSGEVELAAEAMDLILLPLVAFDKTGARLGMGGGFYDATLQHRSRQTRLIGLAYEIQCVDAIQTKAMDVQLDGILTEEGFYEILVT